MTGKSTFLLTTVVTVSFLTIAATSSVVLAQQGTLAACVSDINAHCAWPIADIPSCTAHVRFRG
jgi:hypothetical protein